MIEESYIEEIIETKRKMKELETRYKELQMIFLSEVAENGTIETDDAKISLMEAADVKRLDKTTLRQILVSRHGESIAEQIITDATTETTRNPTVVVRFKNA